jgi:hypothetical protein
MDSQNPNESVTYAVALTYGIPSPLPKDWMDKHGHLSITTERSVRVGGGPPGRLSIELSVKALDLTGKQK